MASVSNITYKDECVDADKVWNVLQESTEFAWRVWIDKSEPFRHTAIALYFNKKPVFTLNFRPKTDTKKFSALLLTTRSELAIEIVTDKHLSKYEYFPFLQRPIILSTPLEKNCAWSVIKTFLVCPPWYYHLVQFNCHCYALYAVRRVVGHVPWFEKMMKKVAANDWEKIALSRTFATCIGGAGVGAVVGGPVGAVVGVGVGGIASLVSHIL